MNPQTAIVAVSEMKPGRQVSRVYLLGRWISPNTRRMTSLADSKGLAPRMSQMRA